MKLFNKNLAFPKLTWRRGLAAMGILLLSAVLGLYLAATAFPAIGANGADTLRAVIGDRAVAQLETWIFQAQDAFRQIKYSLGLEKAASPWQSPGAAQMPSPSPIPSATPEIGVRSATPEIGVRSATLTLEPTATPFPTATPMPQATMEPTVTLEPTATPQPTATTAPTFTPTPTPWRPAAAHALGSLEGEGIWQSYIKNPKGLTVAYRTFIQPDPKRPYAVVAVVAIDLKKAKLNFILGTDEPSIKGGPRGTGLIPTADAQPGVLLAAFNGGFKASHGGYGAMSDGVVALPPHNGLATLVIYKDGRVDIGEYGKDITTLDHTLAWRQNCSLIIENGQINPLVHNNSAEFWGANLNGETVTWRSGAGISPDGNTFYYFAGPNMMMPVLAAAMQAVDVKAGLQLDINNYWVHFTAIRNQAGGIKPEGLFPDDMKADIGRYLQKYSRDFFYVALKDNN